jgi:hypothetical protein
MKARLFSRLAVAAALALTVLIPVSAQAPTYDVNWVAGPPGSEQTYTGTTTWAVDSKGAVTGKLAITSPAAVNAVLSGTVAKDTWTFDYPYEIPEQQCTGVIKGTAKVSADKKTVEGTATIGGGCAPEPFNSTFKFTQQTKK